MNKELHDKAWKLLEEKGLKLGEMVMVRSHFADMRKDEYPFIEIEYKKGKIEYYRSTITSIQNLRFSSEKEVILANAIFENLKEKFEINEFIQIIKFTFRIVGINSEWS